jgi:replicative superfamily II helicase
LIIVPTIALIDETRRRLSRFRDSYKIITHSTQTLGGRNVFVVTQERVLELKGLEKVDFFVLDEFYKLNPNRDEDSRCSLLNQVLYRLIKKGTQFYMLGPSVRGMAADVERRLGCSVLHKPYSTVVSRTHRIDAGKDRLNALVEVCRRVEGPTIVFCSSPRRASDVARHLTDNGLGAPNARLNNATNWIAANYHPDWHFVRALARGVAVHHGRIPRALAQYVVRSFDGRVVKFLVCTSTLIEGVNTKAKNIVVFDNKIDKSKFDTFTFNNIRGRSGRMFEHFIGHVYLFHDPPQDELPLVDIPAITQDANAPTSLLIQLDQEDLKDRARERLRRYAEQVAVHGVEHFVQ